MSGDATQLGADAQALSIQGATDVLMGLLGGADEAAAEGAMDMDDTEEPGADAVDGLVEDADPASETDDDTPEAEEEPRYEVKVDGEVRSLTLEELKAEAQKSKASQKRFEEAAQLRKAAEAETTQAKQERELLRAALDQYSGELQQLLQQSQPDWERLLQEDPTGYVQARHYFEQQQARLQQAEAARAYLAQQQQSEQAELQRVFLEEQSAKLLAAVPEWRDEAKARMGRAEVRDYLKNMAFEDEQIRSFTDHRAVLLARKAMLYDQLMAKTPAALQKAAKVPPRVERPGLARSSGNDEALRQSRARLARSGRMEDGVAAIAALLGGSG